jgi:GT2 family glycosyltransferase
MGLSVIIVSWNAASVLPGCVDSLLENPPDRLYEILAVDNASTDGSADLLRSYKSPVRLFDMDTNLGFAGACNEGYRRSTGRYVLFLNSDIEVGSGDLENLCRFMDEHPDAGAAGGLLIGRDGSPQKGFNVRRFPTMVSTAFEILMVDKMFPRNPVTRRQRMLDFSHREIAQVDQPAGACLLVRRSAFEEVGCFDERFCPAWFEDVDLCLRLKRGGFGIYFVPSARFVHQGGHSLTRLQYQEFLSYFYSNLKRYFAKHHGRLDSFLLRALIAAGMLERILASAFVAPKKGLMRKEALAAYWRVFREVL